MGFLDRIINKKNVELDGIELKRSVGALEPVDASSLANAKGGVIYLGVDEKRDSGGNQIPDPVGVVVNEESVRRVTNKLSNIQPRIKYELHVEEKLNGKSFIIIEIEEGAQKPYGDNRGLYQIKEGSQKRGILQDELAGYFSPLSDVRVSRKLDSIYDELKDIDDSNIDTDFESFVIEEIKKKKYIIFDIQDIVLKAIEQKNYKLIVRIFEFCGKLFNLSEEPNIRRPRQHICDFFHYMIMLVMVSLLIRYQRWEEMPHIIRWEVFTPSKHNARMLQIEHLCGYDVGNVMQVYKNKYIKNLDHCYYMTKFIKEEFFNDGSLDFSYNEFVDADYYIFVKTICRKEYRFTWLPFNMIGSSKVPDFMKKTEDGVFLKKLTKSLGLSDVGEFATFFIDGHTKIERINNSGCPYFDDPIDIHNLKNIIKEYKNYQDVMNKTL